MFKLAYNLTSFILFLLAFISCKENISEPDIKDRDIKILELDLNSESGGTVDVGGIIYKDSNPASNVTVDLYKGVTWLAQDLTDGNGYYEINVCGQNQGAGTYTVRATKYYQGNEWCDTDTFYWDGDRDPELFVIDMYLIICADE